MAQDIRELTVTAVSKREETVSEAPATVTILTHQDFERHGWRNVAEALRSVPGFYVSWGRDYYYTGVRGLSFPRDVDTRILVLFDGHTMNNPWSSSSNGGELLTVPPEAIERVEVIRGPSSSIYGSNAFFAVVNIIVRRPGDASPDRSRAIAEAGWSSLGMYRAVLTGHHRVRVLGASLDATVFATGILGDGPTVAFADMTRPRLNASAPTPTSGVTSGTDYERGYNVGGLASWRGLTLQFEWADRVKGLPHAPDDSIFDDPYNSVRDAHGLIELRYKIELGQGDGDDILVRAYYDRFRTRQFRHRDPTDWDPETWFTGNPHTVSEGNDDTLGFEARGSFRPHERDTLIVGAEIQSHEVSQPTYELDPATLQPDPASLAGGIRDPGTGAILPIRYWNAALYAQNDWRPFANLGLVAGLRFDYNSLFTHVERGLPAALGSLAPRAAAIYSPARQFTAKLLYGEAFRNPSVFEAFFDDSASVCSNPDLRPERLRTAELAGSLQVRRGINASASLFFTRIDGLLVKEPILSCYVGSGPRQHFVNRGAVNVLGGEMAVDVRLEGGVTGFGSFGVTRTEQQEDAGGSSRPLPNSPQFIASAGAAVPLWRERLVASARLHYVSGRLGWNLEASAREVSYLRLDASVVARRIVGGLLASVTVTNVLGAFGVRYRDPVTSSETIPRAIPQDGIAVFARLGYEI